jgi:hypothetical protein
MAQQWHGVKCTGSGNCWIASRRASHDGSARDRSAGRTSDAGLTDVPRLWLDRLGNRWQPPSLGSSSPTGAGTARGPGRPSYRTATPAHLGQGTWHGRPQERLRSSNACRSCPVGEGDLTWPHVVSHGGSVRRVRTPPGCRPGLLAWHSLGELVPCGCAPVRSGTRARAARRGCAVHPGRGPVGARWESTPARPVVRPRRPGRLTDHEVELFPASRLRSAAAQGRTVLALGAMAWSWSWDRCGQIARQLRRG